MLVINNTNTKISLINTEYILLSPTKKDIPEIKTLSYYFWEDEGIFSENFYSFSLQEKSDKFYFRNMNNTSKNLLFLTKPNINSKQFQTKNKTLLYKKSKQNG